MIRISIDKSKLIPGAKVMTNYGTKITIDRVTDDQVFGECENGGPNYPLIKDIKEILYSPDRNNAYDPSATELQYLIKVLKEELNTINSSVHEINYIPARKGFDIYIECDMGIQYEWFCIEKVREVVNDKAEIIELNPNDSVFDVKHKIINKISTVSVENADNAAHDEDKLTLEEFEKARKHMENINKKTATEKVAEKMTEEREKELIKDTKEKISQLQFFPIVKKSKKDIQKMMNVTEEHLYPNKEGDEIMFDEKQEVAHNSEILTLFDVIMVNKEEVIIPGGGKETEPEILIDKTVLAKNPKQARGKAGVEEYIATNDYDETKFKVKISVVMPDVKRLNK